MIKHCPDLDVNLYFTENKNNLYRIKMTDVDYCVSF